VYVLAGKRIYVAGHRGMVGSAIVRRLASEQCEILTVGRDRLDLREQSAVRSWMAEQRPHAVVVAAAKVGGILANAGFPADFLFDNLMIEANLLHAAHEAGVEKLLFLGSSCIYPRAAEQPIREEALLTGPLEPTNEAYAVAKIAGIRLAEAYRRQHGDDFISVMPCNVYGPGDNFDLASAHVVPALIRKAHEAKLSGTPLLVWGSGTPRREFLFVDDLADACVFLLQHYSAPEHLNVGAGSDVAILELAELIARIVGFTGPIAMDPAKPDGVSGKLLDVSRLAKLGWKARTPLREGIESTYRWFLDRGADGGRASPLA
jgi:GDP-L-fucose synthase